MATRLLLLAACILAFGACAKDKAPAKPAPELGPVELLATGQEPRALLRYDIAPGTQVRAVLDIVSKVEVQGDTDGALSPLPNVRLLVQAGPTQDIAGGTRYILRIVDAKLVDSGTSPATEAEAMESELAGLRDMRGRFDIDDRGIAVDSDVPWSRAQENVPPRVLIMLGNVRSAVTVIPLPLEPVGVGAVWEVRRPLQIWSTRVTQVTRYTLREAQDGLLELAFTITQTATPQTAALNPKEELRLRSYDMKLEGELTLDLSKPMTPEVEAAAESSADFVLVTPNKSEPVVAKRQSLLRLLELSSTQDAP
jgi:hypothetical protein